MWPLFFLPRPDNIHGSWQIRQCRSKWTPLAVHNTSSHLTIVKVLVGSGSVFDTSTAEVEIGTSEVETGTSVLSFCPPVVEINTSTPSKCVRLMPTFLGHRILSSILQLTHTNTHLEAGEFKLQDKNVE